MIGVVVWIGWVVIGETRPTPTLSRGDPRIYDGHTLYSVVSGLGWGLGRELASVRVWVWVRVKFLAR